MRAAWLYWIVLVVGVDTYQALAAYRVYELKITPYAATAAKGKNSNARPKSRPKSRKVLSTVDHLQWGALYAQTRGESVQLVDTWYCPGDTSRKGLCKKPKEKKRLVRDPAALSPYDREKRIPLGRQPVIP